MPSFKHPRHPLPIRHHATQLWTVALATTSTSVWKDPCTHPSWEKLYRVSHSRSICLQVTRASSGPFQDLLSFTLVNIRLWEGEEQ